jgi:hypothetical protein
VEEIFIQSVWKDGLDIKFKIIKIFHALFAEPFLDKIFHRNLD